MMAMATKTATATAAMMFRRKTTIRLKPTNRWQRVQRAVPWVGSVLARISGSGVERPQGMRPAWRDVVGTRERVAVVRMRKERKMRRERGIFLKGGFLGSVALAVLISQGLAG
jgi:hypothetical protein